MKSELEGSPVPVGSQTDAFIFDDRSYEIKMTMQKSLDEIADGIVELDEEEVLKELEMVIRVISEDPNTRMEWRSGEGWKWNFKDNIFIGDLNDLKKGLAYCLGIAVHEAGHIRATKISYYLSMWREPGFSGCVNWIEDNRCELSGIAALPGGREWVAGSLETNSEAGGGFNYTDARDAAQGSLGYVPKHVQLGCEIRKYCFRREYAQDINSSDALIDEQLVEDYLDKIPDDSVKEAMKKIAKDTEEFWKLHPPRFADKATIEEYARKSSILLKQQLWPVYKELLEEAVEEHSLAKLLEDMLRGAGEISGEPQIIAVPMDALPEDVQKEIIDKLQEQGESPQGGGEDSGSSESNDNETSDSSSSQNQTSEQQAGQSDAASPSSSSQQNGEKNNPWGDLSDNAKEAIGDVFEDKLTGEQKDQYKEGAQQDITKADDAASEKLRGRNDSPDNVPNSEEMGEDEDSSSESGSDKQTELSDDESRGESEGDGEDGTDSDSEDNSDGEKDNSSPNSRDSRRESQQATDEARRKAEEMQQAAREQIKKEFPVNKFRHIMDRSHVKRFRLMLKKKLKNILQPDVQKEPKYTRSGGKLILKRVIKREIQIDKDKVYERKGKPNKVSVRTFLLGDQSGSMSDPAGHYEVNGAKRLVYRIERVSEIFFPFLDVLNRKVGVETGLGGFSSKRRKALEVYKQFDKDMDKKSQRDMANGFIQASGSTPLLEGIEQAVAHLKERNKIQKMEHNVLIVLTDGEPTFGLGMNETKFKENLKKLIDDDEIALCVLGVGKETEYVEDYFPKLHPVVKVKIMKEVFGKKVSKHEAEKLKLNSFENFATASAVAAIIFEATIKTPEYF